MITLQKINQIEAMLPLKFPNMSPEEKIAVKQMLMQKKAEAISSRGINPDSIPTDPLQRSVFENQVQAGTYKSEPQKLTEEEKAQIKAEQDRKALQEKAAPVMGLVQSLEDLFSKSGGGTFGVGPGARIKGSMASLKGMLGLNPDASVYNDSRQGFAATLKSLTGDTGVLTDQDYARLSKLIPDLGATEKEATAKFNQLRNQIAAKFSSEATPTAFKPNRENNRGPIASLTDVLFPGATDYVEKGFQGQLESQKKPMSITDILSLGAGPLGMAAVRPDVFKQTIGPAAEIATGLQVAGGLKKAGGLGDILNPMKKQGALRVQEAVKAGNLDTKAIIDAGEKYASNIAPRSRAIWEEEKVALQNITSATDLLDKMQVWKNAYKQGGAFGATVKDKVDSGLYDTLYKKGTEIIQKQAPEVAKRTEAMATLFGIPKKISALQKALWLAAKVKFLGM